MKQKIAIIIGAGPAGLTAAYELLSRTDIQPILIEKSMDIGGISRTVNYKGNRIDIGGHRFFSKSKRVMNWWSKFVPMSQKNRISRIFFMRKFFKYPVELNLDTLAKLGAVRVTKICWSYLSVCLFPIRKEKNLEDFFINRFGRTLYRTFFRDYTMKVWGVPCREIKPEWGSQRIKGLSITKAILHALRSKSSKTSSMFKGKTETSLIDSFLYPKLGPGELWEEVATTITSKGAQIIFNKDAVKIQWLTENDVEVTTTDSITKESHTFRGNYLFSTMPMKELIACMSEVASEEVRIIADQLAYRDFITVGLLLTKLSLQEKNTNARSAASINDNWIYIQDNDVSLGRLQIFNNWSSGLLADPNNVWLGLEYFCNEGDELWSMTDADFINFAVKELVKLQIIDQADLLDATIIRVPKAYPAYFGAYDQLDRVISFTNTFNNMFLIGRNGMHKYNNQDHSMLTAMVAVDQIISGDTDKSKIWKINTESDYHETDEN